MENTVSANGKKIVALVERNDQNVETTLFLKREDAEKAMAERILDVVDEALEKGDMKELKKIKEGKKRICKEVMGGDEGDEYGYSMNGAWWCEDGGWDWAIQEQDLPKELFAEEKESIPVKIGWNGKVYEMTVKLRQQSNDGNSIGPFIPEELEKDNHGNEFFQVLKEAVSKSILNPCFKKDDTPRSKFRNLCEGDEFYLGGVKHIAETDAHECSDSDCEGQWVIWDTEGNDFWEEEFPDY